MLRIVSSVLLLVVFIIQSAEYANAQYNESYCSSKKTELTSRATEWMKEWDTATTDVNGLIRIDGKHLTSEIGLTLVNCEPYLDAEDLLALTNMKLVIDDQIDRNIKLGPPCDPLCEPGPPILDQ